MTSSAPFTGSTFDLVAGEVYGVRSWHFTGHALHARSWHTAPLWTPGVNTARCLALSPDKVRDPSGLKRRAVAVNVGSFPLFQLSGAITAATGLLRLLTDSQVASVSWSDGSVSMHRLDELDVAGCSPAPGEDCSCGFYAFTDHRYLIHENSMLAGMRLVSGIIRGFGRTLVGTKGFRCEKAEIIAFLKPKSHPSGQLLSGLYPDVPMLPDLLALQNFVSLTKPEDIA